MQNGLKLKIYSIGVVISTPSSKLIEKLQNDFSYFLVNDLIGVEKVLTIEIENKDYFNLLPKNHIIYKQTENSMYIDLGDIRYNDYYGKALSIMDYEQESAKVYYRDEQFVHELVYLIILSRTGKLLERRRMHKIHACGINYFGKNLIMMMPSKGGKTTLFCELIKNPDVSIISDDTPLVNNRGEIMPFPLRIGHDNKKYLFETFPYLKETDLVEFKREHYPSKFLLGMNKLQNEIKTGNKTILLQAFRSTFPEPKIKKISRLKMLKYTLEHMIIGLGLPLIVEYFLRNNVKDHLLNLGIFFSRLKSAIFLTASSHNYEIYLCSNAQQNRQKIMELMSER